MRLLWCLTALLAVFAVMAGGLSLSSTAARQKVVIAGAGPAGLLAAHSLLSKYDVKRGDYVYDVVLCERLGDPRAEVAGPRAYSLGLNIRGQHAIKSFDAPGKSFGLWHAIAREGVFSEEFYIHVGKFKIPIRRKAKPSGWLQPPPTLMVPRNRLVAAMVSHGEQLYGSRFDVRYNTSISDLQLDSRSAVLSTGETLQYDLALGCDGVYSQVRAALQAQLPASEGFVAEETVLPGSYKVLLQDRPPGLEAEAIHAMECTNKNRSGFSLFVIPAPQDKICTLITWRNASAVPQVLQSGGGASVAEIQSAVASDFPLFGKPLESAVRQLEQQRPSVALTVQCSAYASPGRCVALLGDSAHSTGGTLGQGANSALLDVVALSELLDETSHDVPAALARFSERQTPEGQSLFKLLALPPKGIFSLVYQVEQLIRGLITKLLPLAWLLPTQVKLSQTLMPFSHIVKQNSLWVWLAMRQKGRAVRGA